MTTATAIPLTSTSFLNDGTVILFQGTEYRIIRPKKVNYLVENRAGKTFNLKRTANITVVPNAQWDDAPAGQATVTPVAPRIRFKLAQPVKIQGQGAGRYNGKSGFIAKVNGATYGVLIPNVGIVNASHGLVIAE